MNKILIAAILCVLVALLGVISTALKPAKESKKADKYEELMKTQAGRFKQEDMDRKQRNEMMDTIRKQKGSKSELKPEQLNGMGAAHDQGYMEGDWATKRKDGEGGLQELGPKAH